jgi:RHS repeat-associated protein
MSGCAAADKQQITARAAGSVLTHLGARDYDPVAGRFLTVDPVLDTASPQQMNGYSYGNNNPIGNSDPAGTDPAGACSFWDNRRCGPHNKPPSCGSSASCDHDSGADQYVPPPGGGTSQGGGSDPRSAVVANAQCNYETGHPCTGTSEYADCALQQIDRAELDAALNQADGGGILAYLSIVGNFLCGLTGSGGGHNASAPCRGTSGKDSYKAGSYVSWLSIVLPGGEGRADARAGSKAAAETGEGAATTVGRDAAQSCLNSFTADTPVTLADGTQEPISKVKVGDKVLATDPETGETRSEPVEQLIRHSGEHAMVHISLADGSVLDATGGHPIWDATTGQFAQASKLQPGDKIETSNGQLITITALTGYSADLTAYNLQISTIHTYYAGSTPVLVHNSCDPMSFNQMNQAIQRGQAPKGIYRIDRGKVPGAEQPHAVFGRGQGAPSLNIDGTWKHGYVDLTNSQTEWLRSNGWNI